MELKSFVVGPFSENTYMLEKEGQSVIIDPGFFDPREYRQFKEELAKTGNDLVAVLLTHAHVDHVLGLEKVLKDFNIPVYINHTDLYLWRNFSQQAKMFGFNAADFDFTPEPMPEQKNFQVGVFSFDILYTPGHSPDHVSLYVESNSFVIAGDTLFKESIGRTDLYKGNFELLAQTIREKLYTLPDDTIIYPGHGPSTTIGHEKVHNAFVKADL